MKLEQLRWLTRLAKDHNKDITPRQHAAAVSEMRQVGVPASAGPSAIGGGDRVNAELQHAAAVSEMRQVGVPASAGPNAHERSYPQMLQVIQIHLTRH